MQRGTTQGDYLTGVKGARLIFPQNMGKSGAVDFSDRGGFKGLADLTGEC